MKSKKALSAASYPSRIFKNDVTIKCPDCMVLCSGGCLTVAANSKNKETTTSLFFSRRQRSKVIARVTRNSPAALSCSSCAYLALRGCELLHPLPMVGWFGFAGQPFRYSPDGRTLVWLSGKPSLHLPVVAFVLACPAI